MGKDKDLSNYILLGNKLEKKINDKSDLYEEPRFKINPPSSFDSFEKDAAELQRLAQAQDSFEAVVRRWEPIVKRAGYFRFAEAEKILRVAYDTYISTQKEWARKSAQVGNFEATDFFLRNAHTGMKLSLDYMMEIKLSPTIQPTEVEEIIDSVTSTVSPRYFKIRVIEAADAGNLEDFQKYASLAQRSFVNREGNGLVEETPKEQFILQQFLKENHKRAYVTAMNFLVSQALDDGIGSNSSVLKGRIDKIKEVMLDVVDTMVKPKYKNEVGTSVIAFFNKVVNPAYAELLACQADWRTLEHPLRQHYSTIYDPKDFSKRWAIRKKVPTAAVAPTSLAIDVQQETGLPLRIHHFYESIVERYFQEF